MAAVNGTVKVGAQSQAEATGFITGPPQINGLITTGSTSVSLALGTVGGGGGGGGKLIFTPILVTATIVTSH